MPITWILVSFRCSFSQSKIFVLSASKGWWAFPWHGFLFLSKRGLVLFSIFFKQEIYSWKQKCYGFHFVQSCLKVSSFLYISSKREQLSLALKSRKVKSWLANSYLIVFCLSPQMQLAIYFKQLGNRKRSEKAVMVCLLSKAEIALHLAKTQTKYRQLSWSFIIDHSPSSLKHPLPPVFMTSPAFVF